MNVAVVRRATAGLAAWLAADGRRGTVVVGRDARHGSDGVRRGRRRGARGRGFTVHVLPGPLPTPVLAFAVRHLDAVAGVQITASHNPPADNGYKVYLADGAQIAPPSDAEIEAAITRRAARALGADARRRGGHVGRHRRLPGPGRRRLPRGTARDLRIALTPMHGVGGATPCTRCARPGFTDVHVVQAQAAPDPDFPTVAFPNPEEPGATDLLLALAADVGADLAIALDPDADRCALAVGAGGACSPATRPACCSATTCCAAAATPTRWWRRPSSRRRCCARSPRRTGRATPRRSRVQVDRPRRARAGVRLRGGAGLLRRPGRRARQGRHRRGRARLRPRRRR